MDIHNFAFFLDNLSGCEFVAIAGLISVLISQDLNADEIDILGNFFSALGSNLSAIASAEGEATK